MESAEYPETSTMSQPNKRKSRSEWNIHRRKNVKRQYISYHLEDTSLLACDTVSFGELIPDVSTHSGSRPGWLQFSATPCWNPQIPLRIIRLEPCFDIRYSSTGIRRQPWNSVTCALFQLTSSNLPCQLTYVSAGLCMWVHEGKGTVVSASTDLQSYYQLYQCHVFIPRWHDFWRKIQR
jgi:hypothetical protein